MAEPTHNLESGQLIVISGPSGVGKTTVCDQVLRRLPSGRLSVSMTTRRPRENETDGVDYYFVPEVEFRKHVEEGSLLEHAIYQGNYYGTPAGPVDEAIAEGHQVVLEIDVQGGIQVAESRPDSMRVFILPPSDEVLRERLAGRGTDAPEAQEKRLAVARHEIDLAQSSGAYQHFVTNNVIDETVDAIIGLLQVEST